MADNRSNIWVNIFLVISIIALLFDLILGVSMIIGDDVSYVVTMVFLFTILIWVPVFIFNLVGFFYSFSKKTPKGRLLRILSGLGTASLISIVLTFIYGGVTAEKLEKNYLEHGNEMAQAIEYVIDQLEEGEGIDVEFMDRGKVERLYVFKDGVWHGWDDYYYSEDSDAVDKINAYPTKTQVDSLCQMVGISRKELNSIKQRLFLAKCHSIEVKKENGSFDVATLMFRREFASAYYYEVHKEAMTLEEKDKVDDCSKIIYDEHVCFVYGSPAWGSICFPGKDEYLDKRARLE